ncbi:sigma-70 family RNA polymerase sigma factor [Azospirillum sp. ST 5-10]|uniref:sigma-70 family RNA polymerase sigma factor n=1 Tax=unclassified Azospirillum TaxID=2630922 RepID=UPI003F4A5DAD
MTDDTGKLALFLAHRAALVDYATPIVGDRTRAEDVVQEAFLRFVAAAGRAEAAMDQPLAYLYRVVRNLALDWTRRRSLEHRRRDAEPAWWMVPAAPRTPEQEMQHRQDVERLAAALAELSADARMAVEMHRFGGYTLEEIAEHLGVSVTTAHRLVRNAVVRIAGRLDPGAGDGP